MLIDLEEALGRGEMVVAFVRELALQHGVSLMVASTFSEVLGVEFLNELTKVLFS